MIHMAPFLRGERPYHFDPKTVKTWQEVKVYWNPGDFAPDYGKYGKMCVWCSNNCIGEWSTWNGFLFEKDKDAIYFKLIWK